MKILKPFTSFCRPFRSEQVGKDDEPKDVKNLYPVFNPFSVDVLRSVLNKIKKEYIWFIGMFNHL